MARNDKQALQHIRQMVKKTHWIKGDLKRILEFEYEEELDCYGNQTCKIDPETGQYVAGKMGHCLMGLVAEALDINIETFYERYQIDFEQGINMFPQASRITARLVDALTPTQKQQYTAKKYSRYGEDMTQGTQNALSIERFNDSDDTEKQDILNLLDRAIDG